MRESGVALAVPVTMPVIVPSGTSPQGERARRLAVLHLERRPGPRRSEPFPVARSLVAPRHDIVHMEAPLAVSLCDVGVGIALQRPPARAGTGRPAAVSTTPLRPQPPEAGSKRDIADPQRSLARADAVSSAGMASTCTACRCAARTVTGAALLSSSARNSGDSATASSDSSQANSL